MEVQELIDTVNRDTTIKAFVKRVSYKVWYHKQYIDQLESENERLKNLHTNKNNYGIK